MKGFEELCKTVHHAFEYGFQCNDISFALNKFARENNLPEHDFDADYEEQYGNNDNI